MHFFQHSKQGRQLPKGDVVRAVAPEEAPRGRGWSPFQGNSGSPEPHRGMGESPAEQPPVHPNLPRSTSPPRAAADRALGDPKRCGCSAQSVLSAQRPPGSQGLCPLAVRIASQTPRNSDSAGTKASSAPPSCLRGRRKCRRLRVRFQATPPQCCSYWKNRLFPRVRRSVRRLLATKTRVELVEREPRTSPGVRSRGTWELDGQHHGLAWG